MRLPKEVEVKKKKVRRTSVSKVLVEFMPCPTAGLTAAAPSSFSTPATATGVHTNGGHAASKGALKLNCDCHRLFLRARTFSIASLPTSTSHGSFGLTAPLTRPQEKTRLAKPEQRCGNPVPRRTPRVTAAPPQAAQLTRSTGIFCCR